MSDGCYNIVLLPDDETAKIAVDIANKTYSNIADQYCLEAGKVFPHITLVQFHTLDKTIVQSIAADVEILKSQHVPDVYFLNFGARFWYMDGKKYLWIGLSNLNTPELSAFQAKSHEIIVKNGMTALSATLENYEPHVTFARILANIPMPAITIPDIFITDKPVGKWKLAIGHSDVYGQFLGTL